MWRCAILCLLTVVLPATTLAQDTETLIDGDVRHGGFGGPVAKFSTVDGTFAVFAGGRGGWIMNIRPNHTLVLGGGGYGLSTDVDADERGPDGERLFLDVDYGGVEVEYVNRTQKLVHVSVQALVGSGDVRFRDDDHDTVDDRDDDFFVLEPGANVLLNVTSFFRIGAGINYRFVSGTSLQNVSDTDLSGVGGTLTVKFGGF